MQVVLKHLRFPLFTLLLNILVLGMSGVYFYALSNGYEQRELLRTMGCPDAFFIFSGEWWGIVINTFVHIHPVMLAFNIAGLWILGAFIERRSGWKALLILGLIGSIASSIIQLVLTDDPGIGMSAVNYFLLGYIYMRSMHDKHYHFALRYLALIIGVSGLLLILIGNIRFDLNIGIESIAGGFLSGILFGALKRKRLRILFSSLICSLSFVVLIYCPWSAMWHFSSAFKFHENGQLAQAEFHYSEALGINPSLSDAWLNMNLIKIDRLSKEAFRLHNSAKYLEARKKYEEILKIDPGNKWANDQIILLP